MNVRRRGSVMVAGALITTLMLSSPALSQGGPPDGGGGNPGNTTGSIYADLVIALRADNGTPILKIYPVPATEETLAATEYCVQPVSYEEVPGLTSEKNLVDDRDVWVLPLQGQWIPDPPPDLWDPPVEFTGACDLVPEYAMFASEVELERLNLVRTDEKVIEDKLADVERKLMFAEDIALQSTGRITFDGTTIDASPENAAIYRSLMTTGTIPGLGLPEAEIGPDPKGSENSQFDAWELAAVAIGAAASKGTPLNVDTVAYYNRISGLTTSASTWDDLQLWDKVGGWQSSDSLANSEWFVDYSDFTYSRSDTFKGSVTWLDVPTLTWKVSPILEKVQFTDLKPGGADGLTDVVAFAQLADDVRTMCNFIPDNTFIPGFYMDVPGADTFTVQDLAIKNPAVALDTLPENVFKTYPFAVTASLLNPFGGTPKPNARLRLTIDATGDFAEGQVTAQAKGGPADGQSVDFLDPVGGTLVGWWGPDTGFPVAPGYNVSTTFEVTVADGAPSGVYNLKLELVTVPVTVPALATDTGTITVNANKPTVLWGDPIPKFTTQGTWATIPLQVYAPADGTGELELTVTGPGGAPLADGAVAVYGESATVANMVPMELKLNDYKQLVGPWDVTLKAGYTPVTWYASVAAAAAPGDYTFGVSLAGGNTLAPAVITVFAPEDHDLKPPDVGDDTTAPVVTITADVIPGSTATFTLKADEPVTFVCQLTKDGLEQEAWAPCQSPKEYPDEDLVEADGAYVFSAQATDLAGNVSAVVTYSWVVDRILPVVTITPTEPLGSTATFTLTANEPVTSFECQLTKDGAVPPEYAWAKCLPTKVYLYLQPGKYVFSAQATDLAGNTSEEKSISWEVVGPEDDTPPVVEITSEDISGSTATFTLSANEDPVKFECQLTKGGEAGAWVECTSPQTYPALDPGTYVFSARATDLAGNVSAPVSSESWTVDDTTPPVVTITPTLPPGSTAEFTFTAEDDSDVTIECQLTRNDTPGTWAECESPMKYTGLKPGTYVFSVRATDDQGNPPTVATETWMVRGGGRA